jgi:hypothetical protein
MYQVSFKRLRQPLFVEQWPIYEVLENDFGLRDPETVPETFSVRVALLNGFPATFFCISFIPFHLPVGFGAQTRTINRSKLTEPKRDDLLITVFSKIKKKTSRWIANNRIKVYGRRMRSVKNCFECFTTVQSLLRIKCLRLS